MVFDAGQTVYKLTCDPFQYAYYTSDDRPSGIFFPTLIENHGQISSGMEPSLFLVEMEKLKPFGLKANTPAYAWSSRKSLLSALDTFRARNLLSYLNEDDFDAKIKIGGLRSLSALSEFDPELGNAGNQLADFCEKHKCEPDLHRSNFMLRGNQLVFNDCVKDQYTTYRHNLYKMMPKDIADSYLLMKKTEKLTLTTAGN